MTSYLGGDSKFRYKDLEGAQHGDIMTAKSLLPRPLIFIYSQFYINIGAIMAKVRRICATCGKEFFVWHSQIKHGACIYCSRKCLGIAFSKAKKGKNHPNWKGGEVKQICLECGKEFETKPSEIRRGGGKFCSRKCFETWNVCGKNGNWQGGGLEFTCRVCGKKFRLAKNELNKQKGYFCSRECDFENRRRNKKVTAIQDKINRNMRRAVTRFIHEKKAGRKWSTLVGYNFYELKYHLERDFREGMTWENYGKWHIDHIIPISKFTFSSFKDEGFKKAWALNNLQPLWADENMKKGRRWRWY